MPLGPGAVGERRVVDGKLIEVHRGERDTRRDAHRQRSGRSLGYGRLDADRALYDVGGGGGTEDSRAGRLSARRGRPRFYFTFSLDSLLYGLYTLLMIEMTQTDTATPRKLTDGSWGVRVTTPVTAGQPVTVKARSGKTWTATIDRVIWTGNGISLCTTRQTAPKRRSGKCREAWNGCTRPTVRDGFCALHLHG